FDGGSSTTTFTMASDGLVAQTVAIQGGPGTTTLTTSGASLPIIANALTVDVGGSLTANASILTVRSLSTAGGAFAAGTSTFTGGSSLITLGVGQRFATLTIARTVALASDLTADTLTVTSSHLLTMTSHRIAFNSLAVSGTIADGPVNVTDLSVTNSDTTALVTIAGFSEWSRGSSYAWTHTSSESSQTITWSIGGNAAGIPYTVTKDGSSFATGTVNSSGQVVFTMLGSDPAIQVTVHNPIPPPWWQSSYMLAIFPIGILLGVAMFAQRQRWRPAKAFLVDDSGRMLREFTLDPACQVTYDQAVQAGILDAVDKPGRGGGRRGRSSNDGPASGGRPGEDHRGH